MLLMQGGENIRIRQKANMKRFDQINVIPFIDIMLVLLAIVLTTATFISQGQIEINLPEAVSAEQIQEQDKKTLEIVINAENKIHLDDIEIDSGTLSMELQKISKETPIVLRVDKQVVFENFVQVIDLLKVNKLDKFSIVTIEK